MAPDLEHGRQQHEDISNWGDSAEQLRQARLQQLESLPFSDDIIIGQCSIPHHNLVM